MNNYFSVLQTIPSFTTFTHAIHGKSSDLLDKFNTIT